jgi:glycerate kinase
MALGIRFLDAQGASVDLGGENLLAIKSISTQGAITPPHDGVILLVDVNSPLLGANGAAAIYSPQKGATKEQVLRLEKALQHFAQLTGKLDTPGSGAAGGSAFGLCALWGAKIENGAAKIAELCGLDSAMADADLVITGEGRLDDQSFHGKVVDHISECAKKAGVSIAFCVGSVEGDFPSTSLGGVSLSMIAGSSAIAMSNPERYLIEAGAQLTNLL